MTYRVVPTAWARHELALVRGLDPARFTVPRLVGAENGFALLEEASRPALGAGQRPALVDLLQAVDLLQTRKICHRHLDRSAIRLSERQQQTLGGFAHSIDMRKALRNTAFYRSDDDAPCAPELKLLEALAAAPHVTPAMVTGLPAAFQAMVGLPRAAAVPKLLAYWKTWDLYALALLFPDGERPAALDPCLNADPAQRPPSAKALLSVLLNGGDGCA
jgi:hypothetical protein